MNRNSEQPQQSNRNLLNMWETEVILYNEMIHREFKCIPFLVAPM